MEKDLTELFESVKRAADEADDSPGEEDRCLDALRQLKKFPINYQVLVSTQPRRTAAARHHNTGPARRRLRWPRLIAPFCLKEVGCGLCSLMFGLMDLKR